MVTGRTMYYSLVIELHQKLLLVVHVCVLAGFANLALADTNSGSAITGEIVEPEAPRNRIDITALYLNTSNLDSATAVFGYTRDLASNMSFTLQTTYLDSNIHGRGGAGFGDSSLTFSYVPNLSVVNSAWLPSRVGTGLSVLLPTGNANERRGFDTTIVTPFTGMVYPVRKKFLILPSLAYAHSFGTPVTGKNIRVGLLELGISYVSPKKFWVGAYPGILHNFEDGRNYTNIRLAVGAQITDRIGLSFDWSETEQINFNFTPGTQAQYTGLWNVNLYFQF